MPQAAEATYAFHAETRERRLVLRDEKNAAAQHRAVVAARRWVLVAVLDPQLTSEDRLDQINAVKGRLVDRLRVTPDHEAGVAMALGRAAEELVIGSHDQAEEVLAAFRSDDAGHVDLVVADRCTGGEGSTTGAQHYTTSHAETRRATIVLPEGAVWALDSLGGST